MNLIILALNFDPVEINAFLAPFYALIEKIIVGVILILPAVLLLKFVLKRRCKK